MTPSRPAPDLPPFWTLVEAHGAELMKHAHRLVGNDAEDVLQEAFLRALRSYPRLSHADHLRAWLYRVTTTTAFDHGRKGAREVPTSTPPEGAVYQPQNDGFEDLIAGSSMICLTTTWRSVWIVPRLRRVNACPARFGN
jgi:RNA polymerase sigma-70 factor (ECF subfamily)